MKIYIELFLTFAKIGAFTFGGGYAMLPMLQKEVVEKKHWATDEEIMDYFAVGQCTPGVIFVNTATFVGYYQKGILGGIVATLGVVAPSIIIISFIAALLQNFMDIEIVQHALHGIRIAVCVLIFSAIVKLFKTGVKDYTGIIIFAIALVLTYASLVPTIVIVIVSASAGILISYLKMRKEQSHES
ncbi:chromate transporter [Floccifex sp.]|uniref:chromate transporter n=1 Tax=Floccifex sp. TaxID=2815810 RepID=UPI002A75629A|nr:chromate transporter [Floccifex sp.]MDD7281676.1 chromate transporter [Erysipelotrichaceae bacterium]MDY2958976.1 chromate transporter [Floccifex sp.]